MYMYVYSSVGICDQICQKGCTQISPPFYIYINNQVHVMWPTVHQSAFSEAAFWDVSGIHECPVCIQLSLLAVKQMLLDYKVSHDLMVMLSTNLTILGHFKHYFVLL